MPNFINNQITQQGAAVIAAAQAGTQMQVTRVAVGSGVASGDLTAITSLVHFEMNLTTPQVTANNLENGEVIILTRLDSANVGATFSWSELAVFATSGGGAEQLIAYSQLSTAYDTIASGSGDNRLQVNLTIPIVVGTGSSVEMTVLAGDPLFVPTVTSGYGTSINPTLDGSGRVTNYQVLAPAHHLQHLPGGADVIGYPSPTAAGLVLPNPNDGGMVYVGTNPPTWAPGLLVIRANLTLYVAIGAANVYPNFSSIANALNYLAPYFILPVATVTISVAAGVYASATPIRITHPCGLQIRIVGTIGAAKTPTSITNSGSLITLHAAAGTFTGYAVGSYVSFGNQSNAQTGTASGIQKLTAVAGDFSTITFDASYGAFSTITGTSGGFVFLYQTVLTFAAGVSGIVILNQGMQLIASMAVVGSTSGSTTIYGLQALSGMTYFTNMGATGWTDSALNSSGFTCFNGASISCTSCAANHNNMGFFTGFLSSMLIMVNCYSNFNYYGIRNETSQSATSGCWTMANTVGILSSNHAAVNFSGHIAYYNINYGLFCANHSHAATAGPASSGFFGSGTKDIEITILSSVMREGGPAIGYSTTNVASLSTLTADGCYFVP